MLDKFKNLDKKQKLELYKVLGWSICALIGGAGGANQIGVGADLGDIILGWTLSIVIIFVVFRILKVLKII
ncbi:hypothetical protein OAZ10_01850 [Acidimicrobiaceae bacterium]|nr:hypothetical protein [Acidimicrobiaceae bacterium]